MMNMEIEMPDSIAAKAAMATYRTVYSIEAMVKVLIWAFELTVSTICGSAYMIFKGCKYVWALVNGTISQTPDLLSGFFLAIMDIGRASIFGMIFGMKTIIEALPD